MYRTLGARREKAPFSEWPRRSGANEGGVRQTYRQPPVHIVFLLERGMVGPCERHKISGYCTVLTWNLGIFLRN